MNLESSWWVQRRLSCGRSRPVWFHGAVVCHSEALSPSCGSLAAGPLSTTDGKIKLLLSNKANRAGLTLGTNLRAGSSRCLWALSKRGGMYLSGDHATFSSFFFFFFRALYRPFECPSWSSTLKQQNISYMYTNTIFKCKTRMRYEGCKVDCVFIMWCDFCDGHSIFQTLCSQ